MIVSWMPKVTLPDDEAIVASVKNGQEKDFEILIQRYERRVFSYVLRMVGNLQDAEELAQDCFVRAFSGIAAYQSKGRFRSWLFTVARNLCKNHQAKKYHNGRRVIQEELPDNLTAKPTDDSSGEEIQGWLSSLPKEYRTVMVLKYVADLSCREIAEVESITEAAVKQRLHRGREMIREKIDGDKKGHETHE
ncbi:MAG: RNA polymerase sigma factor [Candidatus Ozemobacteraceae bacterium]